MEPKWSGPNGYTEKIRRSLRSARQNRKRLWIYEQLTTAYKRTLRRDSEL
jgi:hypothetical protein